MTEEERYSALASVFYYWFPIRFYAGSDVIEIKGFDVTDVGIDVYVSKNDRDPVDVSFTDEECYGEKSVGALTARSRVAEI